jgi:hypothetical protein
MEILKENQHKIDWFKFSNNPAIFTYDYEKMRNFNLDLKEEIVAAALNPTRIFKLAEKYKKNEVYKAYFEY